MDKAGTVPAADVITCPRQEYTGPVGCAGYPSFYSAFRPILPLSRRPTQPTGAGTKTSIKLGCGSSIRRPARLERHLQARPAFGCAMTHWLCSCSGSRAHLFFLKRRAVRPRLCRRGRTGRSDPGKGSTASARFAGCAPPTSRRSRRCGRRRRSRRTCPSSSDSPAAACRPR